MQTRGALLEPISIRPGSSLRLLIDVNETLIRTGVVPLPDRLREQADLEEFASRCREITAKISLEIVLITGNSFEYTRRVEEPLGLKEIPGVSLLVVSENGLLARSFQAGDLWRAEVGEDYLSATQELLRRACRDSLLRGTWYSQGNEIRRTLKPVTNAFAPRELERLESLLAELDVREVITRYSHPFYFDLDPARVLIDGQWLDFTGKAYAVSRLAKKAVDLTLAFGDSASDVPMFDAVGGQGGLCFWVGNARIPEDGRAIRLGESYAASINEVLNAVVIRTP